MKTITHYVWDVVPSTVIVSRIDKTKQAQPLLCNTFTEKLLCMPSVSITDHYICLLAIHIQIPGPLLTVLCLCWHTTESNTIKYLDNYIHAGKEDEAHAV